MIVIYIKKSFLRWLKQLARLTGRRSRGRPRSLKDYVLNLGMFWDPKSRRKCAQACPGCCLHNQALDKDEHGRKWSEYDYCGTILG